MFTVKDFLSLPSFQEFEIISGHKGLTNTIASVNIMDNPDAIDWFSVGELLLTSGYFFANNSQLQDKIMHQLKSINCPALCIKPQRYLGTIPENMRILSNELDLPIIQLSYGFSFSKIMTRVNEELTGKYDLINRQSIDIAAVFFELSLYGGGLEDIAKTLCQLTDSTVMLSDENWNILHNEPTSESPFFNNPSGSSPTQPLEFLKSITDSLPYNLHQIQKPIVRSYEIDHVAIHFIFMPVYFHDVHYGYIIVCNRHNILSESTTIVLEQGAMTFALERIKNDQIIRARNRVRRDFLEELITGQIPSKEILQTLAEEHDINLSLSYVAVVFSLTFQNSYLIDDLMLKNQEENKQLKSLLSYLDRQGGIHGETSLYFSKKNKIIFLLGLNKELTSQAIKKRIEIKIKSLTERFPTIGIQAGIGQTVSHLFNIKSSYKEASETIKMLEQNHQIVVGHHDDFLVQHLLLYNLPEEKMITFIEKVLGPLLSPKNSHPLEFLESLEGLIHNRMNLAETARALFIHRNTLLYRKEKLEEILQLDFKDNEDLLKIDLALRFYKYMSEKKV